MNISGKPVKEAWKSFLRELGQNHERAVLVIMHDDLERELGKVRLRLKGSPQGHNGLKSIIKELRTEVRRYYPFRYCIPKSDLVIGFPAVGNRY